MKRELILMIGVYGGSIDVIEVCSSQEEAIAKFEEYAERPYGSELSDSELRGTDIRTIEIDV